MLLRPAARQVAPRIGLHMPPQGILVVDDEPHILASLRELLLHQLEGIEVQVAAGGEEALRLLREHPVEVIICDYRMPGMHGLAFLEAAREVAPKAHRILMTAYPELDVALGGIRQGGIENFFAKPLDVPQVLDTIAAVLYERRAQFLRRRMMSRSFENLRQHATLQGPGPTEVANP